MKKKHQESKKVLVALSGGVDSSVVAALLSHQGHQVIGLHFLLWKDSSEKNDSPKENDNSLEKKNLEDLFKIKKTLGIDLEVVDIKNEFQKWVVADFLAAYQKGLTPNPCVVCNRKVKFNLLLKIAQKLNCDFIATGHYARIKEYKFRKGNQYALLRAADVRRDQSYFLYRLNQEILSKTIFPLGSYTKDQVRSLASRFYLPTVNKADSQEICFVNHNLKSFLSKYLKNYYQPGEVVNLNGQVIGRHEGLPFYTEGQRQGFTIEARSWKLEAGKKTILPFYVISKNIRLNQLIVGNLEEARRKAFETGEVNWVREKLQTRYKLKVKIKIRNTGNLLDGTVIYSQKGNFAKVLLSQPQIGISAGQSAVFYNNEEVLGGGIIKWS